MLVPQRLFDVCLLTGLAGCAAPANTWCYNNFPNAIFCDDFDRYCDPVPPYPQECAVGSVEDSEALLDLWKPTGDVSGPCASTLRPDGGFVSSPPWSGQMSSQEDADFGYSVRSIANDIRNAFGPQFSSVIGTDLNPLILEFVLNGQQFGRATFDNSTLTLASGNAFAPTDWAFSEWCGCMPPPLKRWPVICQQESPIAACPPIANAPSMAAIAVGFLAYLDSNPCHCEGSGSHSPVNHHLSFFDGHKWYQLRQGLFSGSGEFWVRNHENQIRLTIKTTSIKVELTCPDTGEYSWCEVPGAYTGPFSSMAAGFHKACRLNSSQFLPL